MPHLALYRRLRPRDFSQIIGQEHIVRILKNQLAANTVGHAYIFCGTRGTGKTSMAKILAKALNCALVTENGPCGVCDSCVSATENRNLNIIEIDAASNNGVDNVREIREEVRYPPANGGVKVYIIDEVHMLSTGAFNALLKTLEEPPERVVFILATTDVQKIPSTILSRCLRLDFRRVTVNEMAAAMAEFAEGENIAIDMDALRYICSVSDGAMRDALSLLDQCLSYYPDENIDAEKVMALTGAVDNKIFFDFFDALLSFNSVTCLDIITEMADYGRDVSRFISDFINHLRNLMICGTSTTLDIPDVSREKYEQQARRVDQTRLMGFIHEFGALNASLRYAFNDRLMLECLCVKLCNPESAETMDLSGVLARLDRLETMGVAVGATLSAADSSDHMRKSEKVTKEVAAKTAVEKSRTKSSAVPDSLAPIIADWDTFRRTFPAPMSVFLEGTKLEISGGGLAIIFKDTSCVSHVNERKEIISAAILEKYGIDLPLMLLASEDGGGSNTENKFDKTAVEKLTGMDIEWE